MYENKNNEEILEIYKEIFDYREEVRPLILKELLKRELISEDEFNKKNKSDDILEGEKKGREKLLEAENMYRKVRYNFSVVNLISYKLDDNILPKEFNFDVKKYKKDSNFQSYIFFGIVFSFFSLFGIKVGFLMLFCSSVIISLLRFGELACIEQKERKGENIKISKEEILIRNKYTTMINCSWDNVVITEIFYQYRQCVETNYICGIMIANVEKKNTVYHLLFDDFGYNKEIIGTILHKITQNKI